MLFAVAVVTRLAPRAGRGGRRHPGDDVPGTAARRLGLPQDIGNVLFAIGATQALSTGETMKAGDNYFRLLQSWCRPTGGSSDAASMTLPAAPSRIPPSRRSRSTRLTVRCSVVALDKVDSGVAGWHRVRPGRSRR